MRRLGRSDDAASDNLGHNCIANWHIGGDYDRLADNTVFAIEVLEEFRLGPFGRILFIRGFSIHNHIVKSTSSWVSVRVGLIVDKLSERVELGTSVLAI